MGIYFMKSSDTHGKFVDKEFKEVRGGYYDEMGFYYTLNGSFWDVDGNYFNQDGYDKFGGYYDDDYNYICETENSNKEKDDIPEKPIENKSEQKCDAMKLNEQDDDDLWYECDDE